MTRSTAARMGMGVAVTTAGLLPALGQDTEMMERKPNIILCMTDDQGWGDVG